MGESGSGPEERERALRARIEDLERANASLRNANLALARAEESFARVVAASNANGRDLYVHIVEALCEALEVDVAEVTELAPNDVRHLHVLARRARGATSSGGGYALEGTPSETVLGRELQLYGSDVRRAFPDATELAELAVDSYAGVPLFAADDTAIGVLAVMHRGALPSPERAARILGLVGPRIACEIERQRQGAALREAEERFRAIFAHSPYAIAINRSADRRFVAVNPAFEQLFGYSALEVTGRTPEELGLVGQAEGVDVAAVLERARSVENVETTIKTKRGRSIVALLSIAAVELAGEVHTISITVDLTERRRLEEEFRQAQKMEAFGQLAGGVAHDFNNLLTAILGNVGVLQLGALDPAEHDEAVDEISRASKRAAILTRQLLTFSRSRPAQMRPLDLNDIISGMSRMLGRLIGEHIRLDTSYDDTGSPVHADPGMMEQVLMNLVVNARDAMPRGGRIEIRTTTATFGEDDAKLYPKARAGTFVRVTVRDEGSGIATGDLPHIFEPFFTTKEIGRGTGLGLATVFGIVEQHRGWLEVDSHRGEGSAFHVYLPREESDGAPVATVDVSTADLEGDETILLVEDDGSVRSLARRILERHRYTVLEAASGAEALELYATNEAIIDLVLTDLVMPGGMSGRELGERLFALRPNLRVIYSSGYSDEVLGDDSWLRDHEHFLPKPWDPKQLLLKVRSCLDGRTP